MNNKKTYEKPWIIVEAFSTEGGLCLSYGEAGKAGADGSYNIRKYFKGED